MAAACTSGRRSFWFAAAFPADHVPEILEAGDWETADRALLAFCQALARALPPNARFYRWSGNAIVVLMERYCSSEAVRREIERVPVPGDREVFLLVSCGSQEQIARAIDAFITRIVCGGASGKA